VPLDKITARVEEVRFLNRTTAAVRYTILIPGYSIPKFPDRIGRVVLDDGTSKATHETACADLALGGVTPGALARADAVPDQPGAPLDALEHHRLRA